MCPWTALLLYPKLVSFVFLYFFFIVFVFFLILTLYISFIVMYSAISVFVVSLVLVWSLERPLECLFRVNFSLSMGL